MLFSHCYLERFEGKVVDGVEASSLSLVCDGQRIFHDHVLGVRLYIRLAAVVVLEVVHAGFSDLAAEMRRVTG